VTFVPRSPKPFEIEAKSVRPKNGAAVVEAVLAQLVDLRAVGAVVEHADQEPDAVPLDGLELLDVHDEAAVAFDQHDLAVVLGGGDADGDRDRIADRAELQHDVELLGLAAAHMGLSTPSLANAWASTS
jgi:hypothetical protein